MIQQVKLSLALSALGLLVGACDQDDAMSSTPTETIEVTIGQGCAVLVEGRPVAQTDIDLVIRRLIEDVPETHISLKADPDLPAPCIVDVINNIRAGGGSEIIVSTVGI